MTPLGRDHYLIGGAVALAIVGAVISLWPHVPEISEPAPLTLTTIPPVKLALRDAALTRPLFADDRRPAPPVIEDQPGTPVSSAPPGLVGIVANRSSGVALIKTAAGETITARIGDIVDGWALSAIARDYVLFAKSGKTSEVGLDFANKPIAASTSGNGPPMKQPPPQNPPPPASLSGPDR